MMLLPPQPRGAGRAAAAARRGRRPRHARQPSRPILASLRAGTGGREAWVCLKIPTSGRSRVPAT